MNFYEELDKLGKTGLEVFQSLRDKGIKGDRGAVSCPIAIYLKTLGGERPSVGTREFGVSLSGLDGYLLPTACVEFVRQFDQGEYPEMKMELDP